MLATPFAVMGYGALVQRTDFRVREVDVPMPGLPQDLDGLRILQLSDIHLSAFLSEAEFARVIDASLELRPHLAVVTGDLISGHSDPLDACIRQLARVKADAGMFGCMGNHERYASAEDYTASRSARAGIRFLRGEAQALRFGNATLNLAGVDFQSQSRRKAYLRGAETPDRARRDQHFALSTIPTFSRWRPSKAIICCLRDIRMADRSRSRFWISPSIRRASSRPTFTALYRSGAAAAYVTRGIGTIGIPARIGAPPEISLLRLRKA